MRERRRGAVEYAGEVSPSGPGARPGRDAAPSMLAVFEAVGLGVYVLDPRGILLSADDPLALLVPSDRARAGRSLWELDPALVTSDTGTAVRRALDGGGSTVVRTSSAGADRWVEISAVTSGDESAVYCRDITADRVVAEQLADRTRRLGRKAALLDVATDAIFIREMDHTISYWNQGAATLFGRPASDALGSSARTTLHAEPEDYDAATALLLRDGQWSGELTQTASDGRVWIADCRWQLSLDDEGEPSFVLCVITDITDAKRDRDAVYRAQRMDSIGALAGGMAHDLNNVLTPILLSTQLLASEERDPVRRSLLDSIETSAARGADMIRQVLSFARGEESRRSLLDVEALIEQLTTFCAEVLPRSIIVTTHIAPNLSRVLGDSTQLLQILMNLVTNARDAMPLGGQLTLTARTRTDESATGPESGTVVITVQDTGTGMSEQTLAKVFNPFFTTKAVGDGTGLGLSTSIAIARGHGGDLRVTSTLGKGSRFSLRLPAVASTPLTRITDTADDSAARAGGAGERVLVIDDESTIRTIVQHTLEANGYETISAGDGVEAIMLLESADHPVDLVLTDMMMPVMDGAAIAAYLFEHHPQVAVIAASGVEATEEVARAAHLGVESFLKKPFSTDELLHTVRTTLDTRPRQDALESTSASSFPLQDPAPAREREDGSGETLAEPVPAPSISTLIEQEQERARLAAVRDLHLIDTPPEHRFDRITEMARQMFHVPIAQINLVDEFDQFTVSGRGDDPAYLARDDSFCDVAIQDPGLLIVPDASKDSRFSAKETVTGARNIRFYAGQPITVTDGIPVGALCLMDTAPRDLGDHEQALLKEMGRWVERELRRTDTLSTTAVQQVLAPVDRIGRKHFDIAGLRLPGQEPGGSFHDWTDRSDPLGLTLVDVDQAGDGAALIAATVRSAFHARRHLDPRSAVHQVDDQLLPDLTATDTSATAFHGHYDPESGRLDYIDAGHGLTVIVRADGAVETLPPTGLPLGIGTHLGWETQTTHLLPGDTLITATIGLLAITTEPDPVSEIARLAEAGGTAHEIADRISLVAAAADLPRTTNVIVITRPR
jgi:two-component system cell cycle sensor histidine kinase/response regulator CckA